MPQFLRRIQKILAEKKALKCVPTRICKIECLRAAEKINFESIFKSNETLTAWSVIGPRLQMFEIPDGTGGVNPGDRRAIFYLMRYFKPRSVLEVGTHIGASTIYIAAALQSNTLETEDRLQFVSVDAKSVNDPISKPWLHHGTRDSPLEMINRIGCGYFVRFVISSSLDYMAACEQRYDFIFLDGSHAAKAVYQEIPAALELLKTDGLILLHDYFPKLKPLWVDGSVIPGPFLAAARLRTQRSQLKVLPLGELPWPTKLNSNVTSLALLARM
jgi:predicted O-methyltransferase YrrM